MPKSDSTRSRIREILTRRKTQSHDRTIDRLKESARAALLNKGAPEDAFDFRLIHEVANGDYGTPEYILRNLVKHLPNHTGGDIIEVYEACVEVGFSDAPDAALLTDNHITIATLLSSAYLDAADSKDSAGSAESADDAADEFAKIMSYAMHHLEDGPLIITMVTRGFANLQDVLAFLPTLKESPSSALVEGVL